MTEGSPDVFCAPFPGEQCEDNCQCKGESVGKAVANFAGAGNTAACERRNSMQWDNESPCGACKDTVPVVLHANHRPAFGHCLVVEGLRKGADLGVGQALGRTVGVLALGVIV